jgi:hypothetical protein
LERRFKFNTSLKFPTLLAEMLRSSKLYNPSRPVPTASILFYAKLSSFKLCSLPNPSIASSRFWSSHNIFRFVSFSKPLTFFIRLKLRYKFLSEVHFSNPLIVSIMFSFNHKSSSYTSESRHYGNLKDLPLFQLFLD